MEEKQKLILYVSPSGKDSWSGRLPQPNRTKTDGPFATITGARNAIRKLKRKSECKMPITVIVRGGTYYLQNTIIFTPCDSGTKKSPITYTTYQGERVILSGGRKITNSWIHYKDKIMVCSIPEVKKEKWKFRQLFINGKRQVRARIPNKGFYYVARYTTPQEKTKPKEKTSLIFKKGDIKRWYNFNEVEVIIFHSWDESRLLISKFDESTGKVIFACPSNFPFFWWGLPIRYYIENVLEGLDSPGEWYLDFNTGDLYFWPEEKIKLEEAEIIAPFLKRIIYFKGDLKKKKYVKYINFVGFTFSHTDWKLPKKGYPGN